MVIVPPPRDASPPTGCSATGPMLSVIRANQPSRQVCAGQLAAQTFTHALCTCGDLSLGPGLLTQSFDSSAADKSYVFGGAPVGVRGKYPAVGSSIGGSLTVAGTAQIPPITGPMYIQGDLRLAGSTTLASLLFVKRDAWLVSRVGYVAWVDINRNYYHFPSGGFIGIGPRSIGGAEIVQAFTVDDPCGCSEQLDIPAIETAEGAKNDNAGIIDGAALANVTTPVEQELPCGRFRFDSIGGTAPIHLKINGRTAIFVDGNVTASDSFQLDVAPNAELDWFIRGNLSVGAAKIGEVARPSATRIYVAGPADILLANGKIGANIYAPDTNVSIGPDGVAGSVYCKNLNVPSGAYVRYDRAILNQGNQCEQSATCDSKCHSCSAGAACMGTTCGQCNVDEDCCAPLVCEQKVCQPLLVFP
jgi:hypothetical protein